MMFTEIAFMEPIRSFLMAYPCLKDGEKLEIDYMKIDPETPQDAGGAVAFVGSSVVGNRKDVTNSVVMTEQTNLLLVIRRLTNGKILRRDIGDFIFNFIRWVNYENAQRGTEDENPLLPRFSMTKTESIRADGGMEMGTDILQGIDEFGIQIHLEYDTKYTKRSDW